MSDSELATLVEADAKVITDALAAERVMIGGEVLVGQREDNDGSTGDDVRLQISAQYRF